MTLRSASSLWHKFGYSFYGHEGSHKLHTWQVTCSNEAGTSRSLHRPRPAMTLPNRSTDVNVGEVL
eukprot:6275338-Amphidinium_carterae.1